MDIIKKNIQQINTEDQLSCLLSEQDFLQKYVIEILFKSFNLVGSEYLNANIEIFLEKYEGYDSNKTLTNIGYSKELFLKLVENMNNIEGFSNIFSDKPKKFIHVNMGVLYKFYTANTKTFNHIILTSPDLSNEFLNRLKILFKLPDAYTLDDFKEIFEKIKDTAFIGSILIFGTQNCYESIHRHNLSYSGFVREKRNISQFKHYSDECMMDFGKGTIINTAENYYNIDEATFTYHAYNKYNRKYLSGPSGSAVSLFYFITHILKMDVSINIFLISVVDFIPVHHALAEILQTLVVEYNQHNSTVFKEEYTLDKDPVEYTKNIINNISGGRRKYLSRRKNRHNKRLKSQKVDRRIK